VSTAENQLIAALPHRDRRALQDACEPVELRVADVLLERGERTLHVHFPLDGFVSLVTQIDDQAALEVGMVGREGMVGIHVALGVLKAPLRALVQGPGAALRITAPALGLQLLRSAALRRLLLCYVHVLMVQQAQAAACLRFHLVSQRLARWLLMSQDRARGDHVHATHESLAYLLGVRRVGITMAALDFQRRGLITYRRGELRVLDRPGLERAACSCYGADCAAHADMPPR
jgi:CRP-like cAMP-binding protein